MAFRFKKENADKDRGLTPEEEPIKKWRLTFGREKYPTLPRIVRRTSEPGEKTETAKDESANQT